MRYAWGHGRRRHRRARAKGELHLAAFTLRLPPPWPSPAGLLKYAALEAVLGAGCGVVFSSLTTKWSDAPFAYLYRDADVEAVAAGGRGGGRRRRRLGRRRGDGVVADGAVAGPSALSPGLFALAATHESLELDAGEAPPPRPGEQRQPGSCSRHGAGRRTTLLGVGGGGAGARRHDARGHDAAACSTANASRRAAAAARRRARRRARRKPTCRRMTFWDRATSARARS